MAQVSYQPDVEDLRNLAAWYSDQCDGKWEHTHGVTIETLDNPGRRLRVDLAGTSLVGRTARRITTESNATDWTISWVEDNVFPPVGR